MDSLRQLAKVPKPDVHVRFLSLRKKLHKALAVNSAMTRFWFPAHVGAFSRLDLRCAKNFAKLSL
jgi:hypothetical protein